MTEDSQEGSRGWASISAITEKQIESLEVWSWWGGTKLGTWVRYLSRKAGQSSVLLWPPPQRCRARRTLVSPVGSDSVNDQKYKLDDYKGRCHHQHLVSTCIYTHSCMCPCIHESKENTTTIEYCYGRICFLLSLKSIIIKTRRIQFPIHCGTRS